MNDDNSEERKVDASPGNPTNKNVIPRSNSSSIFNQRVDNVSRPLGRSHSAMINVGRSTSSAALSAILLEESGLAKLPSTDSMFLYDTNDFDRDYSQVDDSSRGRSRVRRSTGDSMKADEGDALETPTTLEHQLGMQGNDGTTSSSYPDRDLNSPTRKQKRKRRRKRTASFSKYWSFKAEEERLLSRECSGFDYQKRDQHNFVAHPPLLGGDPGLEDGSSGKIAHSSGGRFRSRSVPAYLSVVEANEFVKPTKAYGYLEFYGFVMYLVSYVLYLLYLAWAYLPVEILHSWGVTYHPDRMWTVVIPTFWLVVIAFIYIWTISFCLMQTPSFSSLYCITDEHAYCTPRQHVDATEDVIPELYDMPIFQVNRILFPLEPPQNKK